MFDYVLTGPISAASAGLYLGGLINEIGERLHMREAHVYPPYFAAALKKCPAETDTATSFSRPGAS
jgi:hypothetical protein